MAFTLDHTLVSDFRIPDEHEGPEGTYFTVTMEGRFRVLHPGKLQRTIEVNLRHKTRFDTPDIEVPDLPGGIGGEGDSHPHGHPQQLPGRLHNGVVVNVEGIPYQFRLIDPQGNEFTADEVTYADLRRFRDHRGDALEWSYTLSGRSRDYRLTEALHEAVYDAQATVKIELIETIASVSAPPLVAATPLPEGEFSVSFDLYRVGRFAARISRTAPGNGWAGELRLIDPDGIVVASSTSPHLDWMVELEMLGRSRDAQHKPRAWTLRVTTDASLQGAWLISADIIAEGRIGVRTLQSRLEKILGEGGSHFEIFGRNRNNRVEAVIRVNDVIAAETLDMHGLFDHLLGAQGERYPDYDAGEDVILFSRADTFHLDELDLDFDLDVGDVRVTGLVVEIRNAIFLAPGTPVIRFTVNATGRIAVKWHGQTLASGGLRNGRMTLEVGLAIDPDGTPQIVQATNPELLDVDFNPLIVGAVATALSALTNPIIGVIGTIEIENAVENYLRSEVMGGITKLFSSPSLAPQILMRLFGAHFTYLPVRFEGEDVLFERIAMPEFEPEPRENYAGAIGRMVMEEVVGHVTFHPLMLGDTWKADNLVSKIDHIVVVMMENRSYDHVLGYRSLEVPQGGGNGITPELIAAIAATPGGNVMKPLRNASFALNELGLRTRIPVGVGHELDDVTQQLAGQCDGPGGKQINDPQGFVDNFRERKLRNRPQGFDPDNPELLDSPTRVMPGDVLGYYDGQDLPFFDFLAKNYAYCDRYFCSHPGPTLPNRMFWLTGDFQYDRYGIPLLENNNGDNFILSLRPTIVDLLRRAGIGCRTYESEPSVAMLRMFSRYATDTSYIRPLSELRNDVLTNQLPKVAFVEPAMHHHPQDDDHPDADMMRGQRFLAQVYADLTANSAVWARTMLIITYDEHGGLYDHVIPPIADVFNAKAPELVSDGGPEVSPTVGQPEPGGLGGHMGHGPGGHLGGHGMGTTVENDPTPHHGGATRFGPNRSPEVLEVLRDWVSRGDETESSSSVKVPYGVRVPTFVVSPWVTPGAVNSTVLDHCSILKTILARFLGETRPFLGDRVRVSHSFDAMLGEAQPRPAVAGPDIPSLGDGVRRVVSDSSEVVTEPLYRQRMRQEKVDYHEISGRLARMLGR